MKKNIAVVCLKICESFQSDAGRQQNAVYELGRELERKAHLNYVNLPFSRDRIRLGFHSSIKQLIQLALYHEFFQVFDAQKGPPSYEND